jgi:tRNA (guanine37-N1)-methyltransferase
LPTGTVEVRIDVVTIFPAFLEPTRLSLLGKAMTGGLVDLRVHDLRDWAHDRHRSVDDTPAGGGAGMVMRPEPWALALASLLTDEEPGLSTAEQLRPAESTRPLLVVPTPAGELFTQRHAEEWARRPRLMFACGRYEGIDQRVLDYARAELAADLVEVSIGDYVLAGGESATIVMTEAVTRLLPGVVGNPDSLTEESHGLGAPGLLEYPTYTRPQDWRGYQVPEVLLSGHHAAIVRWRRDQALLRTARYRPELIAALPAGALDERDLAVLAAAGLSIDSQN